VGDLFCFKRHYICRATPQWTKVKLHNIAKSQILPVIFSPKLAKSVILRGEGKEGVFTPANGEDGHI
jgi:hypothetical protein